MLEIDVQHRNYDPAYHSWAYTNFVAFLFGLDMMVMVTGEKSLAMSLLFLLCMTLRQVLLISII